MRSKSWIRTAARKPFVVLFTVPSAIVLVLAVLPLLFNWLDANLAKGVLSPFILQIDPESAHTLLSVVATGAMTALSLTYSLVLLVFTLAAGNIGPRLLRRFTTEPVNQVTAGIFGGTFLYCLVTMLLIGDDYLPKITVSAAGVLAAVSVLQLIYFVRHVSRSITIDDEIADISKRLERDISALIDDNSYSEETSLNDTGFPHRLSARQSGYVGEAEVIGMVKLAKHRDFAIRVAKQAGDYVLEGETLLELTEEVDEETGTQLLDAIVIEASRSDASNIEFSINLLIEIALRALSPGVNDTFTARACVDSLSNALAGPIRHGLPSYHRCDDDGTPRLVVPGLSLKSMIGTGFHPLRRASRDNILMARAVAKALERLSKIASKDSLPLLKEHAKLLKSELEKAGHRKEDIASVESNMSALVK